MYTLAKYLGVPQIIVDEKPRGDVWDGRVDEEMIGAPYWFLEMYLEARQVFGDRIDRVAALQTEQAREWAANIEDLHRMNAHKYLVGCPAIHFDVMERHIKGGWTTRNTYTEEDLDERR